MYLWNEKWDCIQAAKGHLSSFFGAIRREWGRNEYHVGDLHNRISQNFSWSEMGNLSIFRGRKPALSASAPFRRS
jgi:hypothetical protein